MKKEKLREWEVPYRVTRRGITIEEHSGDDRTDWGATGRARQVR